MNLASKEILARLLATENITVSHGRVQTASFNVRDRILTLPMWEDMQGDTYDHLVGHEVGHALYTPEAGWHESASKKGPVYRGFLNVIEDARIEKMIQARYPGLRRSFISSYKRMLADGFFGADLETINTYGLIDRINTYFKCGRSAGVRIEKSEMVWINEIENLETWEQVVELTDRLYDYVLADQAVRDEEIAEEMSLPENQEEDEDELDSYPDYDQDGEESDTQTDGNGAEPSSEESDDDQQGEEEGAGGVDDSDEDGDEESEGEISGNGAAGTSGGSDLQPKTDQQLRQSIANELGGASDIAYSNITLSNECVKNRIVSYKTISNSNDWMGTDVNTGDYSSDLQAADNIKGLKIGKGMYEKFLRDNKKSINYMVKEFEMKKSASAYSRQTISKTGVIDSLKMNSYQYSDDIFRKISVTEDGKSHGMIMYVDWSGSMSNDLQATIDQLLCLVHFCRQVSIPFRVYAFSDQGFDIYQSPHQENTTSYKDSFKLLEFFNSDMKRSEFVKMSQIVLTIAKNMSGGYWGRNGWQCHRNMLLGGTPLDDAIVAAMKVHELFQSKYKVDIVNTIFLTDGDSHAIHTTTRPEGRYAERITSLYDSRGAFRVLYITDPVTKKRHRCVGRNGIQTAVLLRMYRERTGSTTIGYRIVPQGARHFAQSMPGIIDYNVAYDLHRELKKDKFVVLPSSLGYDKCYAIAGGKNLETSNGAIEVESDASKAKIRTAFKKANSSRKGSRKMLSDLISMVA